MPEKKIIFNRLKGLIESTDTKLKEATSTKEIEKLQRVYQLLTDINLHFESYIWLKQDRTINRVKYFMENECSYKALALKELSIKKIEEVEGQIYINKYNSVKQSISSSAKQFSESIGASTLDLIAEGKIKSARKQFEVQTGKQGLKTLILSDVIVRLPEPEDYSIELRDCIKERDFLVDYSYAKVAERLAELDMKKMAHLLHIQKSTKKRQAQEMVAVNSVLAPDN